MTEKNDQLERMLVAYQKIRTAKADLKHDFDAEVATLQHKLNIIEVALMRMMNETGADSLKIKGIGQAYISTKMKVSGKDWDAIWKYIEDSGNIDLLQRRLSSKTVKEYMDVNDNDLPPGVSVFNERGITVRTA